MSAHGTSQRPGRINENSRPAKRWQKGSENFPDKGKKENGGEQLAEGESQIANRQIRETHRDSAPRDAAFPGGSGYRARDPRP